MALDVRIITGPPSSRVSKEAAAKKLEENPEFPKGATYQLEEVEGRWIAAIASVKKAEFPPSGGGDEAPAEEAPAPEAPSEDGPPAEDGPPSDDEGGEDKPEGKGDEKGKGGELAHIEHLLTTLLTALGLDPTGQLGNPAPGLDEGPPAPPHGGEHPDGEGLGNDNKTHTVHERALKPGEAPPGTTPVGAPAFASVGDDHPWKGVLGQKRTFKIDEPIGDMQVTAVKAELDALAQGTGYRVAQLNVLSDDSGRRIAHALITRS